MKTQRIILGIIRLTFVTLWATVAVEKLWTLPGFHATLLRQPIPAWSADILFWFLPSLELLAAALIAWPRNRWAVHAGMRLSAILMLAFTLFIGFGVLGWYEKRPCGCGSVIAGLSWHGHLWFNAAFFLLALLGIRLTRPPRDGGGYHGRYRRRIALFRRADGQSIYSNFNFMMCVFVIHKRFPRKFALFRPLCLQ